MDATTLATIYAADPRKVCDYLSNPFTSGSLGERSGAPKRRAEGQRIAQALIAGNDAEACRLMREIVQREAQEEASFDAEDEA